MAEPAAVAMAWQQPDDNTRRARLRRMRLVASGLLLLMLAIFVVSWKLEGRVAELGYVRAFAEAGMVGACADWFAVVALFRHPLGLPIPHTAIVPSNKQRIAATLGRFLAQHFFNSTEVATRLEQINVAGWLALWLQHHANRRLLVDWSRGVLPPAIGLLGASPLRTAGREIIKNGIDSIAAAPLIGRLLSVLIAQGYDVAAFDFGLETAIDVVGENRSVFRQKVAERASAWLPGWIDTKLADMFVDALLDTLAAARSATHPWRQDYRQFLDQWVSRFADDPEVFERCERIKADMLDSQLIDDYLAWLSSETEAKLAETTGAAEAFERVLSALGEWLERNADIRDAINRSVRQLIMNTLVPHRDEIGGYVSDVVARWDNKTLVERLELAVGRDLQFIRVNGTVVGGAVGLILYAVARLLG